MCGKRSQYQIIIGNLKIRVQHCLFNMFDLFAFLPFFIKVVCLSSFIIIAVAELFLVEEDGCGDSKKINLLNQRLMILDLASRL